MNIMREYWFWLVMVSSCICLSERIKPWRKEQKFLRAEILQDFFWLTFNGYLFGLWFGFTIEFLYKELAENFEKLLGFPPFLDLTGNLHLGSQVLISLILLDFIEWLVHNLLHRINFLWKIHRVHHSIHIMDWIGNFRFNPLEIYLYNIIKFIPVAIINANRWEVLLYVSVISTIVGHLNHSNLNISWGPLRYIINSPRMHIWHHDKYPSNNAGCNFAVIFSLWDWIFKTAFMPPNKTPLKLGFKNDEKVSKSFLMRFFLPFINKK